MSLFNVMMLAGLAAVAIPPIIHLLNRRRYEVVDWGAMQFLQVSEVTRRRLLIEELLLMLLRMGLIAALVLAWAGPFAEGWSLSAGPRPNRDVVLIFDGSASMSFKGTGKSAHEQAKEWANWSVGPVTASRAVVAVNQEVTFHTKLLLSGQDEYTPPYEVRLDVDGKFVKNLEAPREAKLKEGQVTLTFSHKFSRPGSHLVTVTVEPDPPPEKRGDGYAVKDYLPIDNHRDFALEVVEPRPILLVDGGPAPAGKTRGGHFLKTALDPQGDEAPVAKVKIVAAKDFDEVSLKAEQKEPEKAKSNPRPQVLILCNVPEL